MTLTTAEIAKLLAGEVLGDATATLTGFATADVAKPGDLTFAESEEFFAAAENCAATAIITDARFASTKKILIRVANPRVAFAKAITIFSTNGNCRRASIPPPWWQNQRKLIRPRTSGRIVLSASA